MGWTIKILERVSDLYALAGTTETNITLTNHGAEAGDRIVNSTRRTTSNERGMREVSNIVDSDNFTVSSLVSSQTAGDYIHLFKWLDKSSYLKDKSFKLNRQIGGRSAFDLTFVVPVDKIGSAYTPSWVPQDGQYIKVFYNDVAVFYGTITKVTKRLTSDAYQKAYLICQTSCNGLNAIANRRSIKINYDSGTTAGAIVSGIVANVLKQDGIKAGTISSGITLADEWMDSCISAYELLDACAEKSGYQWFVDDYGYLQFYQDPATIPDAPHAIIQGGEFNDFYNIEIEDSYNNFVSRVFVVGGFDEEGNQISIYSTSETVENDRQMIEGGSGVYGYIHRDSGLVESDYRTLETGTTSELIKLTNHGLSVGDMIWNWTKGIYSNVSSIDDANGFYIDPSITGQVAGDRITLFDEANKVIRNTFKRDDTPTRVISFDTQSLNFAPGQKLQVTLPSFGISTTEYYLIEKVTIQDVDGKNMIARVEASKRDNTKFSTQRSHDYTDYWKNF